LAGGAGGGGGTGGDTEFSGEGFTERCTADDAAAVEDALATDDLGKPTLSEVLLKSKILVFSGAAAFMTDSGVASCEEFSMFGLTLALAPTDCCPAEALRLPGKTELGEMMFRARDWASRRRPAWMRRLRSSRSAFLLSGDVRIAPIANSPRCLSVERSEDDALPVLSPRCKLVGRLAGVKRLSFASVGVVAALVVVQDVSCCVLTLRQPGAESLATSPLTVFVPIVEASIGAIGAAGINFAFSPICGCGPGSCAIVTALSFLPATK
jgi:hypothetical protein